MGKTGRECESDGAGCGDEVDGWDQKGVYGRNLLWGRRWRAIGCGIGRRILVDGGGEFCEEALAGGAND